MENLFETLGKALNPIKKENQCTQCKEEDCSELVYSQGSLVCLPCKEINKESDKRAFDRDMSLRK